MEFWTQLGIEKTKDIEAINTAYYAKLENVHPEEKPGEFMALRSEYEQALAYAKETDDEQEGELSPVDMWIKKVDDVYKHIGRRIDTAEWEKLLRDDVCQSIDMRLDARDALLTYFMEHYHMPAEIWQLLDREFSFSEDKEALYEKFPKDFIDNAVIGGLSVDPTVDYKLFDREANGDIDAYITLYFKANREIGSGDIESAKETLEDMKKTGAVHPMTDKIRSQILSAEGDKDGALKAITEAVERFPDDPSLRSYRASLYIFNAKCNEDYEKGLEDCNAIIAQRPKHATAVSLKADALIGLDRLEDAKEALYDLSSIVVGHRSVGERLDLINKKLHARYDEMAAAGNMDFQSSLDYAWCLFQTEESEKALEIVEGLKPETAIEKCRVENILCKLYTEMENFEKALEHASEWEAAIRALPENEETSEERERLWRSIQIQSSALLNLKRYDEALERAETAIKTDPTKSDAYEQKRCVCNALYRYDEATACAEKEIEAAPGFSTYYVYGLSLYRQQRYQEAYNAFGEAMEYSREYPAFVMRAKILLECGQHDAALKDVEYLKEQGISADEDNIRFIEAVVKAEKSGDSEEIKAGKAEALETFKALAEKFEKGDKDDESTCYFMNEVYFYIPHMQAETLSNEEQLEYLDKGLKEKDTDVDLLGYRAFIYRKLKRYNSAIADLKKVLRIRPDNRSALANLGRIYYTDLDEYEKGFEYYKKRLQLGETFEHTEMAALCLMYMYEFDEAEKYFRRALELKPDSLYVKSNLGLNFENNFEFEKSLPLQKECFDAVEAQEEKDSDDRFFYRCYARVLSRLGRYEEAIEVWKRAIEAIGDETCHRELIELYYNCGMLDLAESCLNKFRVQKKISEDFYWEYLSNVRLAQRRGKEAVSALKNLSEDFYAKYKLIGNCYRNSDNFKKALDYFDKYAEQHPESVYAIDDRIYCLRKLGRTGEIKPLFDDGIERITARLKYGYERALTYTKIAFVHIAAGDADKGIEFANKALSAPLCGNCTFRKCKDAYIVLCYCYMEKGDYKKALEICEEGLSINPTEFDLISIYDKLKKKKIK